MVVQRNVVNEAAFSQQLLFASWSQLLEVTLHAQVGGSVELEIPGRIALLFDLIQDLLLKVRSFNVGSKLCHTLPDIFCVETLSKCLR